MMHMGMQFTESEVDEMIHEVGMCFLLNSNLIITLVTWYVLFIEFKLDNHFSNC